jgi:suppressor of G2 allele of SKP1
MRFFKGLYKDADEDMRRAMMKSYIESKGTALSTNWTDVGKKDYSKSIMDDDLNRKGEGGR